MTKEEIIVGSGASGQTVMTKEEFLELAATQYEKMEYSRTMNCNMTDLENLGYQSAMILGRKLVEVRLANDPRIDAHEQGFCPKCGWKQRIQNPKQQRTLKTVLGEVTYQRPYCVCDRCGSTGAPMDRALGIPAKGPSINALQRSCHVAVVGRSFENGKEILKVHSGLDISRKNLRSISEKEGRRLVEERSKQVQLFEQGKLEMISKEKEKPQLIVVSSDGGRVQTRDKEEPWKEDKIGVVYDAIPQPQPTRVLEKEYVGAKARIKTYVATMQNWESLGWMLCMEAFSRGYQIAPEKIFLADGAPHIREVKNLHFPDATFILDWAHVVKHLNECAKAVFGQGTAKAQAWYQEQKQLLWDGKVMEIIPELKKISSQLGIPTSEDGDSSPRRILYRNAYSYFPNNTDAMDYPAYRAKGWPIGSGVAESAIKQFARRLKGSEKFWNISNTGAEEMLALCALYYSEDGRWDRYWTKRAQPFK